MRARSSWAGCESWPRPCPASPRTTRPEGPDQPERARRVDTPIASIYRFDRFDGYIEAIGGDVPDARAGHPRSAEGAGHARLPAQEAPGRHAGQLLAGVLRLAVPRPQAPPAPGSGRDDLPQGRGGKAQ